MRIGIIIASAAAAGLLGTGAMAQTTAGGGQTSATADGAAAEGGTMGRAQQHRHQQKMRDHRRDRSDDGTGAANSASTYGSGSIYTDRRHATGSVAAGGSASGTGDQATSSSVDAYGSVTRQGSDGEVYGDSTATSTTPQQ